MYIYLHEDPIKINRSNVGKYTSSSHGSIMGLVGSHGHQSIRDEQGISKENAMFPHLIFQSSPTSRCWPQIVIFATLTNFMIESIGCFTFFSLFFLVYFEKRHLSSGHRYHAPHLAQTAKQVPSLRTGAESSVPGEVDSGLCIPGSLRKRVATWRIIPVSKWLITRVSKSPK